MKQTATDFFVNLLRRLRCWFGVHTVYNDWPNGDGFCVHCRAWFDNVEDGDD